MDIVFKNEKIKRIFNTDKLLQKNYGYEQAKVIGKRLYELRAANNLEIMRYLPGRCHELKGARAGQISIDLRGPYRLIFEPLMQADNKDDPLDWNKITCIKILSVEDTHD